MDVRNYFTLFLQLLYILYSKRIGGKICKTATKLNRWKNL
jgi:hypothetical protein